MTSSPGFKTRSLSVAITLAVTLTFAGCSQDGEMSQEQIQYLSHLDQSRFFQRQGELKFSTMEARSAIQLQPERVEPYLVIINNLLTAGDARNAERQLDTLLQRIDAADISQQSLNEAALVRAEANLMQGEFDDALAALQGIKDADRAHQSEATLLKGHILLASGDVDGAGQAYQSARDLAPSAVEPLVGLAKVAFSKDQPEEVAALMAKATEIDPRNAELMLWKGRMAHSQERWSEAEQAYILALETIGQYDVMTYRKFETMSALIDVLRQQGKASEAFVYEEILAKSAPGTVRSNLVAAQEAFNAGDLDKAAGFLEEVLTQAPAHEQAALMLGIIRFRQGRAAEAERLLAPIAAMDESDQANRLLAATRLQLRDPEGAKEVLATIENQDSDPATLALVGIASLASGDTESGEQLIEKALELNPDNNSLRLRYANYHIQRGDKDKAIALAQTSVAQYPAYAPAWQTLIAAQVAAGNLEGATATATEWLQKQPASLEALVIRGDLARQANNPDQAIGFYQQAAEAHPDSPLPLLSLANLKRSEGAAEQAQTYYADALRLDPNNWQALQSLTAMMTRSDIEPLLEELQQAHPEAVGPRLILLESALIRGDQTLADQLTAGLMEREQQDTPAPAEPLVARIYNGIATQLAQREQYEEAADLFARARALFPENETIGIQAATLQFNQGNTSEAREILSDIKQVHPDSAAPFIVEARYFEQQQRPTQAAELYQLALEKEPQNPSLMMSLAAIHQNNNKADEAQALYEQLIEIQPDNAAALNNLAWMYQESGRSEALDLALRAYQLMPENPAIADTYGWILLNNGKPAESVAILEKAYVLAPDSAEIASHLADAYKAVGAEDKARVILEKL